MSSCPTYDPNMLPSPKRGKNPGQSPRNFSPRGNGPRTPYSGYNSPHSAYPRFRSPQSQGFGSPQSQGYGCPYGVQRGGVSQSPRYRSMRGDFSGASPNSSRQQNQNNRNPSNRGRGLFHRDMIRDPWTGLSTDGKSIYKTAKYLDEGFMSYSAKLKTTPIMKTEDPPKEEFNSNQIFFDDDDDDDDASVHKENEINDKIPDKLIISTIASNANVNDSVSSDHKNSKYENKDLLSNEVSKKHDLATCHEDKEKTQLQTLQIDSSLQTSCIESEDNIPTRRESDEGKEKGNETMDSEDNLECLSGDDGTGVISF